MPNTQSPDGVPQGFKDLLDAFGADQTRWTEADRARFMPLLITNSSARRAFEEARALDQLLDQAPLISPERVSNLARCIVVEARATPRSKILEIKPRAIPSPPLKGLSYVPPGLSSFARRPAAAALLAASLVLGVFVGAQGALDTTFGALAEVLGLADDTSEIALATDVFVGGEDVL
jgi:hypothetical protein